MANCPRQTLQELLSSQSDNDLIDKIQKNNDSAAFEELAHRHSGIYHNIVNNFTHSGIPNIQDIRNDNLLNLYRFAKVFNPNANMKFSTFVGQRTRYVCLTALRNAKREDSRVIHFGQIDVGERNSESGDNSFEAPSSHYVSTMDVQFDDSGRKGSKTGLSSPINYLQDAANDLDRMDAEVILDELRRVCHDRRFVDIFRMRYMPDNVKSDNSWRYIAKKMKLSAEGVRQIFNSNKHYLTDILIREGIENAK